MLVTTSPALLAACDRVVVVSGGTAAEPARTPSSRPPTTPTVGGAVVRGLSNDRVLLPIASGAATRRAVGSMLRGHRGLAVGAVVTIAAAVAGLAFPPIVGRITDAVIAGSGVAAIDVLAAALLGALLAQAVLSGWATVLVARLGEQALAALREDVVDRALSVPLAQVERAGTGDLVARVGDDVDAVSRAVREAIPALVVAVVTIALTVVGLAFLDWRLALAGFVAVPIHVLAVRWYQRRAGPQYAAERVAGGERAQQLTDSVTATDSPGVPTRPDPHRVGARCLGPRPRRDPAHRVDRVAVLLLCQRRRAGRH